MAGMRIGNSIAVAACLASFAAAQDQAETCYGPGSVVGAVVGTCIVTLGLLVSGFFLYKMYWKNRKELEQTVNFAERKCGDLMQQLHFYKEYYEKWAQVERVSHFCTKKKVKKSCRQTSDFGSSSENEFEKANQYFYKKIKNKINEMNNEISQANRQIHSTDGNHYPIPKTDPPEPKQEPQQANDPPPFTFENKTCKSEPMMASRDTTDADTKVTEKQSSKSVPLRRKISRGLKKDSGSTDKRFSHLQRYKIRSKSLPQGVRRKFGFGGFFEVFESETSLRKVKSRSKSKISVRADSSKSCRNRKSRTRLLETRKPTPIGSRNRVAKSKSDIRHCLGNPKSEPKKNENPPKKSTMSVKPTREVNTCTAVVPSNCIPNTGLSLNANLRNLVAKPNTLLPFLRNPIPFIPCSSTSKSFNLGLNVQQVLSLIKRKKHSVMLQTIVRSSMQAARSIAEPPVDTLFISQATSHSHVTSAICPAREGSEDCLSIFTDNRSKCSVLKQVQTLRSRETEDKVSLSRESVVGMTKPERPEDVWVVEQPDAGQVRNSRSRCTCFPSKHCVEYNKVLRQYTGWRQPPDPVSSCLCTKPKLLAIPAAENADFTGGDNDGRTEVVKVHSDLLNLTRKYSSLQKQISQNGLDDYEANAELDAMESELAIREVEFKDILNFYNQLIMLKEKLRSLRTKVGQSATQQAECQRPKKNPLRPTPSMAMAKVLKKIQGLQDKIKLIDAP